MNLILIGYRGTGKSTIGKIAADLLGMEYVGIDDEIIRRAGMSVSEIVEKHSWDYFRDLESEVVTDFSSGDEQILDTGGGVIVREENTIQLKENGVIFLLEAKLQDILRRIGVSEDRPSLSENKSFLEEVKEVLETRQPLYKAAADFVIDTSVLQPEEAAAKIAGQYEEYLKNRES